jgi:hypothetical protein
MYLSPHTFVLCVRDGHDAILLLCFEFTFDMGRIVFEFDRVINVVDSHVEIVLGYLIVWHLG